MTPRRSILAALSLALLFFSWLAWRNFSTRTQASAASSPVIHKLPPAISTRPFDPAAPPADMPPLTSYEAAECDSDFQSSASVRGDSRQSDSTHATLTITQVTVTLGLHITIWVPVEASPRILQHEDGHRQISEFYYQSADRLAAQIAAPYIGRQLDLAGPDLTVESSKALRQMATEITAEYNRRLNPGPTQVLYDTITDHGRNDTIVKDAVAHAIKNVAIEAP